MFPDETVSLTQTIQNVRDVGKIFTDFSKTFNVPASKVNNKIFKHYYNFNIQFGFDARVKKSAAIELNSIPFVKGKIKLEGVNLTNNKASSYKITFFGDIVTLKDSFGNDDLSSLTTLTTNNKNYNASDIAAALQLDPTTNDVIVPLITHSDLLTYDSSTGNHDLPGNLYYDTTSGHHHGVEFSELKYAIRIDTIMLAIQSKYGISFSNDFFVSTNLPYYNLFLWLHRKKGDVENLDDENSTIVNGFTSESTQDVGTLSRMISSSVLRISGESSKYTSFSLITETASSNSHKISIFKDGIEVFITPSISGNNTINQNNFTLAAGDYTIYIVSSLDIDFSKIQWSLGYREVGGAPQTKVRDTGLFSYTSLFTFDITQQIPEMKVIDFVTGVFKMFNLTAYLKRDETDITVQSLDQFYASGVSYDISKYVNTEQSTVNVALPYKEIDFQFEDTETILAKQHNQKFSKEWGKAEFTNNGEKLDGTAYDITIPFSKLKYERLVDSFTDLNTTIQYGYFVDDNQDPYFGKPLIFYPIRRVNLDPISFLNSPTVKTSIPSYNIPSNSLRRDAANLANINFFNETNEYTGSNIFTETLFEVYYKNYITSIFNPSNRLTKISANLPLRILLKYTLADRFIISGISYKINSIQTNLNTGKSQIELLNDI